ncbi:hypothetical protein, partial [Parasediminibacterium sp. JCM 36343]|uniref:hypothetical protein n=1 Tax=Parasediminibacterium sp. JCM 36343 TaxID=3374279 RepID=UPI00397B307F
SLTAVASGTPSSYQWLFNGIPQPGATSVSYNNTIQTGSYSVVAIYANGCTDTSAPLLPIALKSFTGYYKAGLVNLAWSAASGAGV